MQIYLLRHAEAESDSARDEARALTAKGSKQAESIGRFCLKHGFIPGVILSSPLTRAEETARLVALQLNLPKLVQVEEFLRAGMTPERALSGLREVFINLMKRQKYSENASIMLVGHEPDLSNLAGSIDWRSCQECSFPQGDTHGRNRGRIEARRRHDRVPPPR